MVRKLLTTIVSLFLVVLAVAPAGYGKSPDPDRKTLKLGCLAYSEPMLQWIKEGLAPLGYKVEVVMFDANQLPATALKDGSIDGIIANHRPWILTSNKENNAARNGQALSLLFILRDLFDKAQEAERDTQLTPQEPVPGDPTNLNRSLIILGKAGLITLGEKTGPFYTVLDIKSNPRKIKIIETEITQTARSVQDVDAIVSAAFYVGETDKSTPRSIFSKTPRTRTFLSALSSGARRPRLGVG